LIALSPPQEVCQHLNYNMNYNLDEIKLQKTISRGGNALILD
jgi:hypothetical protein